MSIERHDNSPSRVVVRHRRVNLPHTPREPEGLSSDADEEEAEDEPENKCNACCTLGNTESTGFTDRHVIPWSRSTTRLRGPTINRQMPPALRLKTMPRRHDSGHTTGEDEKDLLLPVDERAEIPVEQEACEQNQGLDQSSVSSGLFSNLFRLNPWRNASGTSPLSPTRGHDADGEESETDSTDISQSNLKTAPELTPNVSNVSQTLFVSTEPCSTSDPLSSSRNSSSRPLTRFDVQPLGHPNLNLGNADTTSVGRLCACRLYY